MTDHVQIVEVGPRDGLQNESSIVPTPHKIKFIEALIDSGLTDIELTACVHSKAVPQMADAEVILNHFKSETRVQTYVLAPNQKGYERSASNLRAAVAVVVGTTNAFNEKNIRATTSEALNQVQDVCALAEKAKRLVRGYISTAFGCPYQGTVSLKEFMTLFDSFYAMGIRRFSIGDTIGVAHPTQVKSWVAAIRKTVPDLKHIALHMHDTYGRGLVNCAAGYDAGIRWFDSSAGGLGGCPYAAGASGNVATEDLLSFFETSGIKVVGNPQAQAISEAVGTLGSYLGNVPSGHLFQQWYKKNKGKV